MKIGDRVQTPSGPGTYVREHKYPRPGSADVEVTEAVVNLDIAGGSGAESYFRVEDVRPIGGKGIS